MREKLKSVFKLPNFSFGIIIIIFLVFVLGFIIGHRQYSVDWNNYKPTIKIENQQPLTSETKLDFKLFWDTWDLVSSKYIDKKAIDPKKLYFGAIQGMVAAIGDPYTAFLPPDAQKASKEQLGGSFEGVGMQLGFNKDKRLVVVAPLKDTPAEKAGIKAGDYILTIDSKDTNGLSLPEAVNLIRGPKGSTVKLSLFREDNGKPWDLTLTRDTINVRTVDLEEKTTKGGKKIAYIRLSGFGQQTNKEWDETISNALAKTPQGVIVDVRNNPGGYLEGAVYIGSEFVSSGSIVMTEDAKGQRQELTVQRGGKMIKMPLVVLVNKGSASSSEIFAGAMQDYKRAKIVGSTTFGKGTIQSTQDLPEDTGIHITTAKWLTPKGRWIHNTGLEPDVKVELIENKDEKAGTPPADNQLDEALKLFDQ